ncbi:MAG: 6-hydroxycyclohex-1-ene-1-carbonyl-CoA dehydrogenase [Tistrella sp.]|nr:6-hydroxycyclohex-1-ene-1-carbonyl-CoA dehydrogenase [Tistrella sp.]
MHLTCNAWQMQPGAGGAAAGFSLEAIDLPAPQLSAGEALVEIAGCGICGTDLSYFYGGVPTVASPPLILGHEVSGRVVEVATAADEALLGRHVVVPTVIPCRKCELCRSGRANRCLRQRMLCGNYGTRGGFASHVAVPAGELTPIPEDCPLPLARMAVVADAVSTPFQAVRRARLNAGDKVIVIGATGGLGVYVSQWAKLAGAAMVVGIARDAARLDELKAHGLDAAIPVGDGDVDHIRHELWNLCRAGGHNPRWSWTIFEASGTLAGQRLGLDLLTFASKLILVGYAGGDITTALSKVMAYDAEIIGSWGCDPRLYADVIAHVSSGDVDIMPFTETRPMSRIRESFAELKERRSGLRRIVLTNDWAAEPD